MTRFGAFFSTYFSCLGIGLSSAFHPTPWLLWNATASTPVGLYRLHAASALHVGDLVAIHLPDGIADQLARGGYLPRGVPLLKPVAALPGQTVCRTENTISVDGVTRGTALVRDHLGRPLPVWRGCQTVWPGQVFVMNPDMPTSLDGRYFGLLPAASVLGRATPVWTRSASLPAQPFSRGA
ncbi:S26 family signal peptidase [Komagataeibacter oboediens]|uniref:S26 family signal peptidase n=1 Tax=Komagataeibacter oboediens TaxID=65958 RepID=UPI001C2CCA34|nr:S26 family signal peptidase [Komagataeibacter oboediens]MBV1825319.1 S26 family signal peptidase [Komagataeibacter oboediens]